VGSSICGVSHDGSGATDGRQKHQLS
jgi:hypothetical protein